MRRPAEPLAQRQLAYELRAAIDREQMARALDLIVLHPRGIKSAHVRHNLGLARLRALRRYVVATARSSTRSTDG